MRERRSNEWAAGMAASIENIYLFYTHLNPIFIPCPMKTSEITKKKKKT
jgi:hypothetical protein